MHGFSRVVEMDDGMTFEVGVDERTIRMFIPDEPEDDARPVRFSIIDGPDELAYIDLSITAISLLGESIELMSGVLQKQLDSNDGDDAA